MKEEMKKILWRIFISIIDLKSVLRLQSYSIMSTKVLLNPREVDLEKKSENIFIFRDKIENWTYRKIKKKKTIPKRLALGNPSGDSITTG